MRVFEFTGTIEQFSTHNWKAFVGIMWDVYAVQNFNSANYPVCCLGLGNGDYCSSIRIQAYYTFPTVGCILLSNLLAGFKSPAPVSA